MLAAAARMRAGLPRPLCVLGIESTCDDSAVGVVEFPSGQVLADVRKGQWEIHEKWGGVMPNLAHMAHRDNLPGVVRQALEAVGKGRITHIAVSSGPGMRACISAGLEMAQLTSQALGDIPVVEVNHLEAHTLVSRLVSPNLAFPFLSLVVSGGNSFLALSSDVGKHQVLGHTMDDALGEAFDKVGRALLAGQPLGSQSHFGAVVENLAKDAKPSPDLTITVPMRFGGLRGYNFSFSGLKTATLRLIETNKFTGPELALAFQNAAFDHVSDVVLRGLMVYAHEGHRLEREGRREAREWAHARNRRPGAPWPGVTALVVSGGVASNQALMARMSHLAKLANVSLVVPAPKLCVDNGVMIAWTGAERVLAGLARPPLEGAKPQWPLDQC